MTQGMHSLGFALQLDDPTMPAEINIQTLFAQLRLEHLLVYLPTKGWQGAAERCADRLRFELAGGERPYVVSLPRSNQASQSRRLLQAAIYTLCDVEDRQPAEIIHEMLAVDTRTYAPPSTGAKVRLRLINSDPIRPIALNIGSRPVESFLMPGEAIEIVADSNEGGVSEIAIRTVSG